MDPISKSKIEKKKNQIYNTKINIRQIKKFMKIELWKCEIKKNSIKNKSSRPELTWISLLTMWSEL